MPLRLAAILLLGVLAHQTHADAPEAIVGGTQASPREFPYQCSLNFNGYHMCGCSIIGEKKVLTAAHCVHETVSPPYDDLRVRTGSIDKYRGDVHAVKSIKIHPEYEPDEEKSWVNDIAVITLQEPIEFSADQSPVKLPNGPPRPGHCILTGWGDTLFSPSDTSPRHLLKMNTVLIDNKVCEKRHVQIYSSQVCALTREGVGACHGDGGGPLVCNGRQYGIVSFVTPCATGIPDVYTSVYYQLDFVKREMAS